MEVKEKRIVLWCGAAANQKALANKIAQQYNLAGIVVQTNPGRKRKISEYPALIIDRLRFSSIYNAWKNLMIIYDQKFPKWPDVPILRSEKINTEDVVSFTRQYNPDLILVSGTALIKEPLLSVPCSIGIINLHTGLSPYVKGGPNCTNWCIANNEWHLVGNTIMWLNAGIDSGNIITTATVDIKTEKDLNSVHFTVMEHAHDLYLKSISYLLNNKAPYQSVPQADITKGNLYLTKMWTAEKRKQLLKNWKNRNSQQLNITAPIIIPLPN